MKNQNTSNILIGVCGSIAAYKTCDLINRLRDNNCNVKCVMTNSALNFITPLTLETLSKNPVYHKMFETGYYTPEHISLADWAGLIVIAPATATTIARMANGLADDLLASTVLATRAPVLICPAMNENMWFHPATKENVSRLKSYGYSFIGPGKGMLACGIEGHGRLVGTDDILKSIFSILKKSK